MVPPPGDTKGVAGIVASAKAPYVLSPVVVILTLVTLVTPSVSEYRAARPAPVTVMLPLVIVAMVPMRVASSPTASVVEMSTLVRFPIAPSSVKSPPMRTAPTPLLAISVAPVISTLAPNCATTPKAPVL